MQPIAKFCFVLDPTKFADFLPRLHELPAFKQPLFIVIAPNNAFDGWFACWSYSKFENTGTVFVLINCTHICQFLLCKVTLGISCSS